MLRIMTGVVAAAAMAVPLAGMAIAPAEASTTTARVVRWVDGDTVVTTRGTVRLIGVDTPEVGTCGADKATSLAKRLAPAGSSVRLGNPDSVQDADRYGRVLRYIKRGTVDVGLRQIKAGAQARYDSQDGYDFHPAQSSYRAADRANPNYRCATPAPSGGGSASPRGWDCPSSHPIKGNQGSPEWIYHMPWNAYYDATNPEECFATEAAAQRAGYRAAKI